MDHTCHYSEGTDSTLYLQLSLISLKLVPCNIQKKARRPLKIKKKIYFKCLCCYPSALKIMYILIQTSFLFNSLAMIPVSRMHAQTMNIFVSIICPITKYS